MTTPFTADSALAALSSAARSGGSNVTPLKSAAFDAVRVAVGDQLSQGAASVNTAVAEAQRLAEALWAETRATPAFALGTPKAACGKGCGWCCHQRVGAASVEVLSIADALRDTPESESLRQRVRHWPQGRACAFLVDGACAIYAMRPLKCRSLYQLDARWCMSTYAKIDLPMAATAPPSHLYQPQPKEIFDGAVLGLAQPFHQAGHDCAGVDFMPALKAVLDRPDATAAWWRGESVFPAEARLHDWFPPQVKAGKKKKR